MTETSIGGHADITRYRFKASDVPERRKFLETKAAGSLPSFQLGDVSFPDLEDEGKPFVHL